MMRYRSVGVLLLLSAALSFGQQITWQDIGGIPGCFALRRGDGGKLFAAFDGFAAYDGKIFSSTDNGLTWTPTTINYGWVHEIATRGHWVVTSRDVLNSQTSYQVFLSSNNGASFSRVLGNGFASISSFMVSDSGAVYGIIASFLPGGGALAKLTGARWNQQGVAFLPGNDFGSLARAIDHANNFFIGSSSHGLYVSTNLGANWINVLPQRRITALNVEQTNSLLLGASPTVAISGGVFSSSDTGKTWTFLGLAQNDVYGITRDSSGTIFAATTSGIFKYGGTPNEWNFVSPIVGEVDDVINVGAHTLLATSIDQGLFVSLDDGTSWNQNGIRGQDVSALLAPDPFTVYLGTLGNRLFVSTNGGTIWTKTQPDSICDYIFALAHVGAAAFAGTDCGIFRSVDTGSHWVNVSKTKIAGGSFALAAGSTGALFAGTNYGVYVSGDTGSTWSPAGLNTSKIISLVSSTSDELFAATATSGIYASPDGGLSWTSLGLVRDDIQTIGVTVAGTLVVGVDGGVVRSTDHGLTWQQEYFVNGYVYSLAYGGANIIAGTGNGVFLSTDDGISWSQQTSGIAQSIVLSVAVTPGGNLLAGTYHGGLYKSNQTITAVEDQRSVPVRAELFQNYPNPFNPVTEIRFEVPVAGFVSLKIYDALGREIVTLVNEVKQAGSYVADWDASGFASGVYFYHLRAGQFQDVKKLVLMK